MPKFILKISAARDADCANDENIGCLIQETSLPEEETALPPLPGSAAAPMPVLPGAQGATAAMIGTQNGMTARSGG